MTKVGEVVCTSETLQNGGRGARFQVTIDGVAAPAFVVRYRSQVYAYLNRCAHKLVELDWEQGQFFDHEGRHLICTSHGARYRPEDGVCIAGPCPGARLVSLEVFEGSGQVFLEKRDGIHLIRPGRLHEAKGGT
jgi:nitrite reductase/ring-hydroxylating ferredoxin subunit